LYLIVGKEPAVETIQRMLFERSGLAGISRISFVMRVLRVEKRRPEVVEAIDYFWARARGYVGSLPAALGATGRLVFRDGMGADAAEIRKRISEALRLLGIDFAPERRIGALHAISRAASKVRVEAVPTHQELAVPPHIVALLRPQADGWEA
jgi:acetate kinase